MAVWPTPSPTMTSTWQEILLYSLEAMVMVQEPSDRAVTWPLSSTVATARLLLAQIRSCFSASDGVSTTWMVSRPPWLRFRVSG